MRKTKTKWLALIASLAVAAVLCFSFGVAGLTASAAQDGDTGYYYASYNSLDDAYAAAEDVNAELAEEGIVLLKNRDDALPLAKGAKVSVLGLAQDCLVETIGTIPDSLKDAGFKVNPTLEAKYSSDNASFSNFGSETPLTGQEKTSIAQYSDAAVIVIGRGNGGESADRSTNTGEEDDNTYLGENQKWLHEAHDVDAGGTEYKHELQLTASEEELIKLAEDTCDKVIVLYTASYTFEMANLQEDDNIDAILWIGRLGRGGTKAVGEILCGDVNPSGKTVDEWTRDFTNDPSYANWSSQAYVDADGNEIKADSDFIANIVNGPLIESVGRTIAQGIDYEEDIYIGYKWYETYWKEANSSNKNASPKIYDGNATSGGGGYKTATADEWYSHNVVYPFGYGLSYTEFSYELKSVTTNTGTSVTTGSSIYASDISTTSASDLSSKITSMTASVAVTNTGAVSGKETVEIYVEAPYTSGGIEKPAWTLVGFGKTGELKPDQSETLDITFNTQDFASYDYSDANEDNNAGYELDCGEYKIHVMESSSHLNMDASEASDASHANAYETCSFSITGTSGETAAHLEVDDYTGNKVENRFSTVPDFLDTGDVPEPTAATETETDVQSDFYSMAMGEDTGSMVSPLTATETNPSTILSRSDFDGTMPKAPEVSSEVNQLQLSSYANDMFSKYDFLDADEEGYTDEGMIWAVDPSDIPTSWKQGQGTIGASGMYATTLNDMAGVPWDVGKTDSKWDEFMNQLSYTEIRSLVSDGKHYTVGLESIGKVETLDDNGPNYTYVSSDMPWVGEPTIAATWNTELGYEQGRMYGECALLTSNSSGICMTGWYGPGMNIHRNQFGGRAPEYYSQDSILSGYMGSHVVRGATDMGINVYLKHFAIYENGEAYCRCAQITEQNIRETYLRTFKKAMQEGGARAAMTAFTKIGSVYAGENYALITQVARGEWGWKGFVVTDIYPNCWEMSIDGIIRAGAEIPDGAFSPEFGNSDRGSGTLSLGLSGTWVEVDSTNETWGSHGGYVKVSEESDDVTNATQWYCARMSATRLLYNEANSAGNMNGVTEQSKSVTLNVTQGAAASVDLIDGATYIANGHTIDKVELDGEIFEAMTVSDGTLTGTVWGTESGGGTITIYVDGWIPIIVSVDVNVTPVINIGLASSLATGSNVLAYVTLATGVSADSVSVSLLSGELPSGLTLAKDGTISGTPTEAGDYDFTLAVDVVNNGVVTTYTLDYSVSVTGDTIASGGASGGVSSDDLDRAVQEAVDAAMDGSSSGGNGMAVAGLVIGIVAIVAVAVVLVIVLMPKGKKKDDDQ